MIYTGVRVYNPILNIYSTGYRIQDNRGNWYPIWNRNY